ncbi:MAG: hypothetical protein FJ054_05250 [Cyanobacteria bacterium M_surface_10_m2_119]|nr:hypothetical protein [Cyanobacteria bacterium M_surface_10_m2_119]
MTTLCKLLLAMTGTGLLAPLAANAQDASAISSAAAISSYMEQQDIDRRSQWVGAWESHNQVTDNISITPAIFYASDYRNNGFDSTWGGVIQTTFRF